MEFSSGSYKLNVRITFITYFAWNAWKWFLLDVVEHGHVCMFTQIILYKKRSQDSLCHQESNPRWAPLTECENDIVNTVTEARVISRRYGHIFWFVTAITTPNKAHLGVNAQTNNLRVHKFNLQLFCNRAATGSISWSLYYFGFSHL